MLPGFHSKPSLTLDISLHHKDAVNASLTIKLEEADYQESLKKKIREFSAKANIKGFRPGKVPPQLIQKMYGKSLLADTINEMLGSKLDAYIRENKLNVLGNPLPNDEATPSIDWDSQKEFSFTFDLGLVGDFTYTAPEQVQLVQYTVEPSEKDIESRIEHYSRRFGQISYPETSDENSTLFGELKQVGGDFEHYTAIRVASVEPAFKDRFIGLAKEAVVEFDIEKAFDHATIHEITHTDHSEHEHFHGPFTLTVKNINRLELSEMNEEFFAKVYPGRELKTEADFRAAVIADLTAEYSSDAYMFQEASIKRHYLDTTEIELPKDFIRRWLKSTNEKLSEEQIDADFPKYLDSLKWQLVYQKIATDADVQVAYQDLMEYTKADVRRQLRQYGLTDMSEEQVESFAKRHLSEDNGKNVEGIYTQVLITKVYQHVVSKAQVTPKSISPEALTEEFRKIYSAA